MFKMGILHKNYILVTNPRPVPTIFFPEPLPRFKGKEKETAKMVRFLVKRTGAFRASIILVLFLIAVIYYTQNHILLST